MLFRDQSLVLAMAFGVEADTISVLHVVARGRAQVGVHAAKSDWSKRIRDFQYMDYDDYAAHISSSCSLCQRCCGVTGGGFA